MQQITEATIEQLKSIPWFSAVGRPLVEQDERIIIIPSVVTAIQRSLQDKWVNLRVEAVNSLRDKLLNQSLEILREWTRFVKIILPTSNLIADVAVTNIDEQLRSELRKAVFWDIHYFLIETEFSKYEPLGFHAFLSYWYSVGHFPCGWEGRPPGGKLIIH